MAVPIEILLTSETTGQLWNIGAWNPESGTSLLSFKGGTTSRSRTLCCLGDDYLLAAVTTKPLIHVWKLQKQGQEERKIVCPGMITALTCSPDGTFCVGAINEKLHVWQVCTGHLLAVLSGHYQTVTSLKMTDDSSHLVSGGEDNLVLVWFLGSILGEETAEQDKAPRHMWSAHSLPITDIHVGHGGVNCRVATSSMDQTCRLWDLASGELLLMVSFDNSIMSVAMDSTEARLFAGSFNGNIYQVNLFERPVRRERHISDEDEASLLFKGHSKQVTCLAVSVDGCSLVSGSQDCNVKLWDINSLQCVRSIPHKGAITNLLLITTPSNLNNSDVKPVTQLKQFQRFLYSASSEEGTKGVITTRISSSQMVATSSDYEDMVQAALSTSETQAVPAKSSEVSQAQLKQQLSHLAKVNKDLYQFAVNEILNKKK